MTSTTPPTARREATERSHHGHTVIDHYEWMRQKDSPALIEHLEAENSYTRARMAHTEPLQERIVEEIRSHTAEDDASVPVRLRGWWYFSRIAAGQQYRRHYRAPVIEGQELNATDIENPVEGEQLLADGNAMAEGHEFFNAVGPVVSPNDERILIAVDVRGDERYDLQVIDIASGEVLDQAVEQAVLGLVWGADSDSFTYLKADEAWRHYQFYAHRLGTEAGQDVLLRQEDDETYWTHAYGSRDGKWAVLHHGSSLTSEVRLFSTEDFAAEPILVSPRSFGLDYSVEPAGDHLLVVHNRANIDFELAWAPLSEPSRWQTVLNAEAGGRLLGVDALDRFAVVECRRAGYSDVLVLPREGADDDGVPHYGAPTTLALPGEVRTLSAGPMPDPAATEVRVLHTSLLTPPTTLMWNPATGQSRTIHRAPAPNFDPERYAEKRTWATAGDGTRIPISYAYRRDLEDQLGAGTAPGLLYGYGSYEISTDPAFSAPRLSLLDRGVVCAYAHIRGGGEMGRSWYEEGKTLAKRTTFTDFLACADHLADEGIVDGQNLVAEGGSAGGLLIGAAINLDPARFRAVHAAVPFVDALTTILDPDLPLSALEWEEWGNPITSAETYAYMASYTPYENIQPATYPAILATTSLNDTRVFYVEPAKWVARLRETVTSDQDERPILLRCEMVAGHGGRSGRYNAWGDRARELAFLLDQLGIGQ